MKMSDFFGRDAINFFGFFCCELPESPHEATNEQLRAAFHAINQHDALTQLNKELVEALERVAKWNELNLKTRCDIGSNGARDYYRGIAEEALAKAKELAE
jgi:hypothetical protein